MLSLKLSANSFTFTLVILPSVALCIVMAFVWFETNSEIARKKDFSDSYVSEQCNRRRMCSWTRSVARELIPFRMLLSQRGVNPIKLAYDIRQPDGRPHSDQRL